MAATSPPSAAFTASKARAMELLAPDLDRSHAGGIDPPILTLCELINARTATSKSVVACGFHSF